MTPVYISGCFGMLHPAAGSRGVVICGTIGDEALNAYRPLVFLAEQFAAAGAPTLRLDYYGAGDSGGDDSEPGRSQAWLAGIAAGVRWLRQTCGVGPVTLVGVRAGAVLAARAVCDVDDIDALVLLAPVPSGRRFVRELILYARTIADIWQLESHIDDGSWFEARGLRLDRPTRQALEHLDIAKLPRRPAPRALVLDQHDSPAGGVVAERLRRLGTEVTCESADGLETMLRDPYENAVPHHAFARAVSWHGNLHPGATGKPGATANSGATANPGATADSGAMPPRVYCSPCHRPHAGEERAELATDDATETPVYFGPHAGLFGILSTPVHPLDGAPPVLIASTGANPRYGNSRVAVTVARWLAANGIASMRMDCAGVGDSAIDTGARGRPYSAQDDSDLSAGIDELSRRFGTSVLLLGMCSGAFHALRAASEDRRVAGLMLVNLQKFVWREGDSLSVVHRITPRTTGFYLRNLIRQHAWQRLMSGKINIPGIACALAVRALRRTMAAGDPALAALRHRETHVGRVRRRMRDLQQRNLPILFVLSGNDPGLVEVGTYFGSGGRQIRRQSNVMFCLLEGADHTLSAHSSREALLGLIGTFLRQRCRLMISAGIAATPVAARVTHSRLDAAVARAIAPVPVAIDSTGSAA
jgi:dienelactone hydrolase